MADSKFFWKSPITLRILSWLLSVSLLPLLIAGFISFKASENEIKKKVIENLMALADSKGKMFTDFIIERETDVKALALMPIISTALEKYKKTFLEKGPDSSEYIALDNEYMKFFTTYTEAFGYHDLFIISHAGNIVFTVKREDDFGTNLYSGDYKDTELARAFIEAIRYGKSNVSNFKFYVPSNEPAAFIGAPIVKRDARIGAVVFQLKNEELYREVQNYIGLGETGEVVIAYKEGNEAVFITPLRNDPDAAFKRRVRLGSDEAMPIQKAVQRENGLGLSTDYRNKRILSVWRYLPHLKWGMVVKIDTDEAFESIYYFRNRILTTGFIAIVIVLIIGLRISRAISEPIKTLQKGSEKIGRGELDTVIEIESKDEIGQLAASFNKMTVDLKNISKSHDQLNREINERKHAEEELHQYEYIVSNSNDMMALLDRDFTYLAVNDAYIKAFDMTKDQIIGHTASEVFGDEFFEKTIRPNAKHCLEGEEVRYFEWFKFPSLGRKYMEAVYSPYFGLEKEIKGFVVNGRDVTKRKQAEEEREKLNIELKRSNRELEHFAYIASHDLRSPLLAISGFADLLKKRYKDKLDKEAHEYIDFIVNSIGRMENLINGLLTYSRIGASSCKFKPVDLKKIFVRAIADLTVAIERNGARITYDSLPTVLGNDVQLEQLLQNLIGNAIKFHSQESPRIHISVKQKAGNWVFSVKDNGIGIASENREKIFDMFKCLDRGKYKGTGIGLAVCKKIVERHGGNIWVESQANTGSIFYFTMPITSAG